MTRRQIARQAFDKEHRALMLRVRHAPKGQITFRRKDLRNHVTERLRAGR